MTDSVHRPRSVALVVSHLHPTLGLERAVLNLRESLTAAGIDVEILILGGDDNDQRVAPSAHILGPPMRGKNRLDLARAWRLRKCLTGYDVIILAGIWAALPALAVAPTRRSRFIVWEHSLISEKLRTNRSLRLLATVASILYRRADLIVGVSQPLAAELRKRLPSARVLCIPNPVAPSSRACPRPRPAKPRQFLMIGSLTHTKNQQLAIEALALMSDRSASLVIAGDGPDAERLAALIAAKGLHDRVKMLGHVSPSTVAELLAESGALVHTATGETFGYVYFEAAAAGRPVIAVENVVVNELIPSLIVGRVVKPDPLALSLAMQAAIGQTPSEEAFRKAHAARARRFSPQSVARAWAEAVAL